MSEATQEQIAAENIPPAFLNHSPPQLTQAGFDYMERHFTNAMKGARRNATELETLSRVERDAERAAELLAASKVWNEAEWGYRMRLGMLRRKGGFDG